MCIVWDVLVGILCCCCRKSKNEQVAEEEARLKEMADQGIDSLSLDIFADFRIGALQDKFNKAKHEMDDYEVWMKQDVEQLDYHEKEQMFANLTKRVEEISAIVDQHVVNLLEEQSEVSPVMERQILELRTSKKLILLELNEGTLKDRYRSKKESCLRMKGIT